MYILTGGAGFIGSVFLAKLNAEGIDDILVVDNLGKNEKWKNLLGKRYSDYIHKSELLRRLEQNQMPDGVKGVIHLGACSSTVETDAEYVMQNNFRFSCALGTWAAKQGARFVYASSAATYGNGDEGFSDDDATTAKLRPLNIYGYSKQLFDQWATRSGLLQHSAGIKFFNVFGPNEYHKGNMASVVYKAYFEISEKGNVHLFRSHRPEFKNGEQKRDFIYVKDCADAMWWLLKNPRVSGVFNLGTGVARTWNELAISIFAALKKKPVIEYTEMPITMRPKYQYFTEANMQKLKAAGYDKPFTRLEDAVADYVQNYLAKPDSIL